jgi:hypothetical protein
MVLRRLATVVAALALAVCPAFAQVTDALPSANRPATAAAVSTTAPPQTDSPPAQVSPVPEPGSILFVAGTAAIGWVAYWRRKWRVQPTDPTAGPPPTE